MANRRMITKDMREEPEWMILSRTEHFGISEGQLYADDEGYLPVREWKFRAEVTDEEIQNIISAGYVSVKNGIALFARWTNYQEIRKERYTPSVIKRIYDGELQDVRHDVIPDVPPVAVTDKRRLDKKRKENPPLPPKGELDLIIDEWKEYKKQSRDKFTPLAETKLRNRLNKIPIDTAKIMLDHAIEHNWKGIYELSEKDLLSKQTHSPPPEKVKIPLSEQPDFD